MASDNMFGMFGVGRILGNQPVGTDGAKHEHERGGEHAPRDTRHPPYHTKLVPVPIHG